MIVTENFFGLGKENKSQQVDQRALPENVIAAEKDV